MPNDGKLGLLAGVAVVLVAAVFFYPRANVGPAAIPAAPAASAPAAGPGRESPPDRLPAQSPPPAATIVPADAGIWKFSEPRTHKPVSRDPLMWPRD